MNVSVAVGAILADVGKDGLGVALRAAHFLVHAPERVLGLVVVEFRDRANGPPAGGRVAVLAGDSERTVRTAGVPSLSEG